MAVHVAVFALLLMSHSSRACSAAKAQTRQEVSGTCDGVCVGQGQAKGGHAGPVGTPLLLIQKEIRSSVKASGTRDACLCVFDIDRTLTSKQGLTGEACPGSRRLDGVWDDAYGGGMLTLSALASTGLDSTFCGGCYIGVCSAGSAGGHGSSERTVLMEQVLMSGPQRELLRRTPKAREWSKAWRIDSPFVLSQPDTTKHHAVAGIVDWYRGQGIHIPSWRVHFFGDRTENIRPFRDAGFNAQEISCGSRDWSIHHGMVGLCGATPQEIVADSGVRTCQDSGAKSPVAGTDPAGNERSQPRELDSSPGRHGGGGLLEACQGDCDGDRDCAAGLRCFQRRGREHVPGCGGEGIWGFDYCYDPAGSQPTHHVAELDSSPGRHGIGKPLGACQGDCDNDGDCAGNLRCFQRSYQEPVPGCSGLGVPDFDYCFDPSR